MDIFVVLFLIFSFASVLTGFVLEGGSVAALISASSALIVIGGTIGAVGVSFPSKELKRIPGILKVVFSNETHYDKTELLPMIIDLCKRSRKDGILSLEGEVDKLENPLMRKGLGLIVDGFDTAAIRKSLEMEMDIIDERHKMAASIFESAGGYAPTMGIIGTVLGLVHVLGSLEDPAALGGKIAMAFVATLYGIATANFLWLPMAKNLKNKNKHENEYNEMIIEGLMMIREGVSSTYIQDALESFLTVKETSAIGVSGNEEGRSKKRVKKKK